MLGMTLLVLAVLVKGYTREVWVSVWVWDE